MGFDFKKASLEAKKDLENDRLFLVLLGSSGHGKSFAIGSLGVKTLHLYTQGESHGPQSASTTAGNNIVPVCIDRDDEGNTLTPDAAMKRLHHVLDSVDSIKEAGFGAIAIDGATELEALIKSTTKFKVACDSNGKHNGFAEGPATLAQFREIVSKLKMLQRELGVHVVVTCILNIKEYGEDGIILDSAPQLGTFGVATGVIQQFNDVMVVGKMQRKGVVSYRFQLMAGVNKSTKDFETKEVKKTYNFSPRITGVDVLALGETLKADLSEIVKLKSGGK